MHTITDSCPMYVQNADPTKLPRVRAREKQDYAGKIAARLAQLPFIQCSCENDGSFRKRVNIPRE